MIEHDKFVTIFFTTLYITIYTRYTKIHPDFIILNIIIIISNFSFIIYDNVHQIIVISWTIQLFLINHSYNGIKLKEYF